MATEKENEVLRLALAGKLRPEHMDDVEDEVFTELVVNYTLENLVFDEISVDEVILWLTEPDCRGKMRQLFEAFRDSRGDRLVRSFSNKLLLNLTEPATRDLVIRVFSESLDWGDKNLSKYELAWVIVKEQNLWMMERFLRKYGFEPTVAETVLERTESLNDFPDEIRHNAAIMVDTEDFSNTVLKNSEDMARDLPLLPLVSKETVIDELEKINSPEEVEEVLTALKGCREELRELGKLLENSAATAKLEPGRPDAEKLEEFKQLKAVAKRDPHYYRDRLRYMESDILAYELTLKAQETALARAVKAEENGTVSDPLKVSEIEGTIAKIKAHIRMKAVRDTLRQLQEATV